MINTFADDLLLVDDSMCDIIAESEADSSAASGLNETIHRTGVEGIFSVYELWVQHYIPLLALGDEVGQAFPVFKVPAAYDSCCCNGRGEVSCGCVRIFAFRAEDTVYPSVLVFCQTHIVDVRFFRI